MSVRLQGVTVTIGDRTLLEGINLDLAPGRIVCVVGPNGAGKTTLLDAICRLVESSGTIELVGGRTPNAIGRAFQGSPLPATLTVAECCVVATRSRARATALMERFGLAPHASSFVSELSTGMRRILDLALATANDPDVLILDEPSSGLATGEIDELAQMIRSWRDTHAGTVLIVEHDASLVSQIADEVVVLVDGRIVATGTADKILEQRRNGRARLKRPNDPAFQQALHGVAASAAPPRLLPRRSVSTWTLLRLGLRQFAAGMAATLIFGVLNRVLKVELGVSLALVAPVLASLNLAAPFAVGVGHWSDTRPLFGRRRVPYIIGGAVIAGLAVAAAPHAAEALARGVTFASVTAALALFVVMGLGMYGAGTVFFALLADLAPERERGHAASVVYLMMLAGIFAGVGLTAAVLREDAGLDQLMSGLVLLFAIAGILVVVMTILAVWGVEPRTSAAARQPRERARLGRALAELSAIGQARRFFVFMVLSTVFLFLQKVILEPYGGEVLGMDVRTTTAFNAMLTFGILLGMLAGGRPWATTLGHIRLARLGLVSSGIGFGALAFAAWFTAAPPSWITLLIIGAGTGIFTVAGLALMMGMASRSHAALLLGAWTVAHALAEGVATGLGGLAYEGLRAVTGTPAGGYAAVFAIQCAGLFACIPLLRRLDPAGFRQQTEELEAYPQLSLTG